MSNPDTATFDFASEYEVNPDWAVRVAQLLLIDEDAINERVELLNRCAAVLKGTVALPRVAGRAPRDHLGEHRVVEGRYLEAGLDESVDTHAGHLGAARYHPQRRHRQRQWPVRRGRPRYLRL